ncbi:MAG TPA: MFS transporter [Gaiellales bacterium]|nr:MFS transporter [Gaiellales bacterium]
MSRLIELFGSRRAAAAAGRDHATRPIVVIVRTLLLFESAMYSAVTPVLPHYAHALHLGKPAVGLLTASYPAGIVPGSLLAAWATARLDARRATIIGLLVLAGSVGAFGFGSHIALLDALRFLQGIGCGFIWVGGLTWVIGAAEKERRGRLLGSVFAAAILGTILGPVLGTFAVAAGTGLVFSLVGAVALALAAWTRGRPAPSEPREREARPKLRGLITNGPMALGSWLILLEAATVGATSTLIPLRLAELGGSGALIGATFVLGSALSAVLAGPIGRATDRLGPRPLLWLGLPATAALMALLIAPTSAVLLGIVTMAVYGGPLTLYTVPAMTIMTDGSERAGIPVVIASLVLNLAWALGEAFGAPAAATLSEAGGNAVPLLGLAALMMVTLWPVARLRMPKPADPGGARATSHGAASTAPAVR